MAPAALNPSALVAVGVFSARCYDSVLEGQNSPLSKTLSWLRLPSVVNRVRSDSPVWRLDGTGGDVEAPVADVRSVDDLVGAPSHPTPSARSGDREPLDRGVTLHRRPRHPESRRRLLRPRSSGDRLFDPGLTRVQSEVGHRDPRNARPRRGGHVRCPGDALDEDCQDRGPTAVSARERAGHLPEGPRHRQPESPGSGGGSHGPEGVAPPWCTRSP
jgi:hypothetical protein